MHTHIPEANHVPRGYTVTAILSLLFMVPLCLVPALVLLFFYVSTFRSMCAVPNMAVFCSYLTSWFPGMLLTYFLNENGPSRFNYYLFLHSTYAYYYYYYYYILTITVFKIICQFRFHSSIWFQPLVYISDINAHFKGYSCNEPALLFYVVGF